jgi:hypothetical protein
MDIGPTVNGIDAASILMDSAGAQIAQQSVAGNPDAQLIGQQFVNLTLAGVSIDVQARVQQAQQETVKSLLDIVG